MTATPTYDFDGQVAVVTGAASGMGLATYHASTHGVIGLTKSAALEYAPRGVRINRLCSPGASFVHGVALPVDGGYTAQ